MILHPLPIRITPFSMLFHIHQHLKLSFFNNNFSFILFTATISLLAFFYKMFIHNFFSLGTPPNYLSIQNIPMSFMKGKERTP